MAITVAQLVAVPHLQMRFHAGESGGGRVVTWAHSSDLPNAIEWLAPGDLLMSNGLNVPAEPRAQEAFVVTLASAGLSGVAIGDDMHSPRLVPDALARADELAFPVLAIPHEVPFVAVSRTVASANSDEEHERLVRTVQLYDVLRGAVSAGRLGAPLLEELGRRLGCRLVVLDAATALPVVRPSEPPPRGLGVRLVDELRRRGGVLPGVLRLRLDDGAALAIHVPAARPTALVALLDGAGAPDLALLHHAATIAALEVERVVAEREQARRLGTELVGHLLERRLDPASARSRLEEHGVGGEDVVVVAFRPDGTATGERDLHHELVQREIPHLLLWNGRRALMVLSGGDRPVAVLRGALGGEVALGVSDPLRRPDRLPDAAREAHWAQAAALTLDRRVVRYGDGTPMFLPRTLGEAEVVADRVLGAIIAYDDAHATNLLHSLAVFLEHNRSWQRAAVALHVHKQTLVYRMHRVEELSGRTLSDTADVAQLWLALRAHEFAHGALPADGRPAA